MQAKSVCPARRQHLFICSAGFPAGKLSEAFSLASLERLFTGRQECQRYENPHGARFISRYDPQDY
jgi:hypothetical protein